MKEVTGQLSLLPVLAISTEINRTFQVVEKKDEKGNLKRQSIKLMGRKEFAQANELSTKTDADKITELMLQGTDSLKEQLVILAQRLGNNPNFTGGTAALVYGKKGVGVNIRFNPAKRPDGPSVQLIAAKLGLSEEQVNEMIARQTKQQLGIPVDVEKSGETVAAE